MVLLKGKTQLAAAVEPKEGNSYIIKSVEEVKTAVQGFSGVRVTLEPVSKAEKAELEESHQECATMLWMRERAGQNSKLGAFLAAFTKFLGSEDEALDTDNWLNHTIRFISWKPRNREIVVVE